MRSVKFRNIVGIVFILLAVSGACAASISTFSEQYNSLHEQWAKINYSLSNLEQGKAYAILVKQAKRLVAENPNKAESFILLGLVESNYAPLVNGTSALSISKDAKKSLERSLRMDDSVLEGLAYTLLGKLYHDAPKWPLGFGNNKNAHKFFGKALLIKPNGFEVNHSYAVMLFDELQYRQAKIHLLKALKSNEFLSSQIEDESRRSQTKLLLRRVNMILNEDKTL